MTNTLYSETAASTSVSSGYVLTFTSSSGPQFLVPTGGSTVPATPGGNTGNIQVNSSTTFYGDDNLTYLASIARVSVGSSVLQGRIVLPTTASGNTLTIVAASNTDVWQITLPSSPGSSGFVLKTDGAGVTSWTSQSGGTVTGQALTSSNDTNVTLTLTGNASVALLSSVDMVVGWTGTLSSARLNSNVVQTISNDTNITGSISSQQLAFAWNGTLSSARLNANVVQTATNDTNVTATISSQNIALGWTGALAVSRGGTGSSVAFAFTKTDDTNVTATLTGNASVSLLSSFDFALGWTGTLSSGRLNANVVQTVTNDTNVTGTISSQNFTLGWTGALAIARGGTGSSFAMALTKTDDTNVTATLTGNASVSLISSVNIALGWTGTLSSARLNANVVQSASNDTNVTGTISSQQLTLGWTGTLSSARLNANVVQTVTNDTNVTGTISSQNFTLGWTGTLAIARGGTGSSLGTLIGAVSVLTDSSNVSLDASLGNLFTLEASSDRTITAPINPTSGQKIVIRHFASGGTRTLTLSTASSGFRYGSDITGLTATVSSKTDYIGCIYNSSASFWDVVAYSKGY